MKGKREKEGDGKLFTVGHLMSTSDHEWNISKFFEVLAAVLPDDVTPTLDGQPAKLKLTDEACKELYWDVFGQVVAFGRERMPHKELADLMTAKWDDYAERFKDKPPSSFPADRSMYLLKVRMSADDDSMVEFIGYRV